MVLFYMRISSSNWLALIIYYLLPARVFNQIIKSSAIFL